MESQRGRGKSQPGLSKRRHLLTRIFQRPLEQASYRNEFHTHPNSLGGSGIRAVLISRRKPRRTNSEKLIFSRRALPAKILWTRRGSRNVTGTLPPGSFVLGMQQCVLLYHARCQYGIFLPRHIRYDSVRGVRDKESTAITITLPVALDRALQALADQKHCGNKSAAIRELLYKEAGMQAKLRMNEKRDIASVAKAERRYLKYGTRKKKREK